MKTPPRSAFTLIELLLVISIIGVLSTLVAPAINTMMRGSRLTQAGDKVVAVLSQARQTALTTNHSVEVRFYQYGDAEVPGESKDNKASGNYRAIQIVEYLDNGAVIKGKVEKLPLAIIIDSSETLSTLLKSTLNTDNITNYSWGVDPTTRSQLSKPSLLTVDTNYNCCVFRFLSDGSTNLPTSGSPWFLTMQNLDPAKGDNKFATTPPPNYTTIKIDPVNGSLKVYRP